MTIGSNIKKLRTARRLTQDQLAEKLYVTRQTVSNWERGTSQPSLEQLEAIAEALEADVMTLLYGPRPDQVFSRKRLLLGLIGLVLTLALWIAGTFGIFPVLYHWAQRTYVMHWVILYRGLYRGGLALLGVGSLLTLASAFWDLTLKERGRKVCLGLGITFGVLWPAVSAYILTMGFGQGGGDAPFLMLFFSVTQGDVGIVSPPLAGLCALFLFLALNPSRRDGEKGQGDVRKDVEKPAG